VRIELTEDQELLHRTVRDFASAELRPNAARWDHEGHFPAEVVPKLAQLGLLGLNVPPDLGGAGLGMIGTALAVEAVSWGDASIGLTVASHNSLCTGHILHFASDGQKRAYLPELASGRALGAWCLTEAQAGSDAANIQTRAVRRGTVWVLNGAKMFVTQGTVAGVYVVLAVTDPAKGRTGISAFIVDRETPGLRVGKKEDKLGLRASDTAEVVFEDCEVPAEALIGAEGEGYRQAMATLERGRVAGANRDRGHPDVDPPRLRHRRDACQRRAQVALDIHRQRLERRDVEHAAARLGQRRRRKHQPVEAPEKGRKGLSAAGRGQHQRRLAAGDRRPPEPLRRGGRREGAREPLADGGMEDVQGHALPATGYELAIVHRTNVC